MVGGRLTQRWSFNRVHLTTKEEPNILKFPESTLLTKRSAYRKVLSSEVDEVHDGLGGDEHVLVDVVHVLGRPNVHSVAHLIARLQEFNHLCAPLRSTFKHCACAWSLFSVCEMGAWKTDMQTEADWQSCEELESGCVMD